MFRATLALMALPCFFSSASAQLLKLSGEVIDSRTFNVFPLGYNHGPSMISPNGRYAVLYIRTKTEWKKAVVIDLKTIPGLLHSKVAGRPVYIPVVALFPVSNICELYFSPDSNYLAAFDRGDRTLSLHDLRFSKRTIFTRKYKAEGGNQKPLGIHFTPDSQFILIANHHKVEIRIVHSPDKIHKVIDVGLHLPPNHMPRGNVQIGFSKDGRFGYIAPLYHVRPFLYLLDFHEPLPFETKKKIETKAKGGPLDGIVPAGPRMLKGGYALGFTPDGSYIIMQGHQNKSILFIPTAEEESPIHHEQLSKSLASSRFSADWYFEEDGDLVIFSNFWTGENAGRVPLPTRPKIRHRVDMETLQVEKPGQKILVRSTNKRDLFSELAEDVDDRLLGEIEHLRVYGFSPDQDVIWWRNSNRVGTYFHFTDL